MRQLRDRFRGRNHSTGRRGKKTAALAVILATVSAVAIYAWADSPDPKLPINGRSIVNADGSITVLLDGQWRWPTHKSDCNLNRYAAGWAIDWNDALQPGGVVGTVNGVTVDVGTATANAYNPKDLNTHFYVAPSPPNNPRCGVYSAADGFNTGSWGPTPAGTLVRGRSADLIKYPLVPDTSGNLVPTHLFEAHTYAPGTTEISACVVTYDIHGSLSKGPNSGDLISGGTGHAHDNSVQSNGNTPLGNGCFTRKIPIINTVASFDVATAKVTDTAHLGGGSSPVGEIQFKAFGPYAAADPKDCAGAPVYSATVPVNADGDYSPAGFTPPGIGEYRWTAKYVPTDPASPSAISPCGSPNESVTVNPQASITITPDKAANAVGHDHVFTITVKAMHSGAAAFVPEPNVDVTASLLSGPGTFVAPGLNKCTTNASGQCTVTLHSDAAGISTVKAEASPIVDGQQIDVSTNGVSPNSGPAKKQWVSAHLDLTPPTAVNQVKSPHEFTAHLQIDYGDGLHLVDAPNGEQIGFEIVAGGVGSLSASNCQTSGNNGTCKVTLNSTVTGTTDVKASWQNSVLTASGTATGVSATDTAVKKWVNALILITPDGTNEVNKTHTFHVAVSKVQGGVTSPADGVLVTASEISDTANSSFVGGNTCTTDTNGNCDISITSDTAGTTVIEAEADVTVEGLPVHVAADGQGTNAPPGTKHWVNARLTLSPPNAVNHVNDPHVFTAFLEFDTGSGFQPAPDGKVITFDPPAGVGSLTPTSCTTGDDGPSATDGPGTGKCSVTLTSAVSGTTTVTGHWAGKISVSGLSSATINRVAEASKVWVDALISISPDGTNEKGNDHTFTVTVSQSNAGVTTPADNVLVTAIKTSDTASSTFVGGNTCTTSAAGTCTITINSTTTGKTVVKAAADVTVNGVVVHAETDGSSGNAPAVKHWVDASLTLTPHDATNNVGDPHTFTATLKFDRGDGKGFVAAPDGEQIDFSIAATVPAGVGTLDDSSCLTAGGTGECTVVLRSDTAGHTTVQAAWAGKITVDSIVSVDPLSRADQANKTWVSHPAIKIVKSGASIAHEGDVVTYTFDVTNTGDVPLTDVAVTDDVLGSVGTIGDLDVGITKSLSKDFTIPTNVTGVKNVATTCGVGVTGAGTTAKVCDDDPHSLIVIHPKINIVKTADPTSTEPGNTVTYSYDVTNSGDTELTNVVVTDDILGDIGTIASLKPGETKTLTGSFTVAEDSPRTNIGTACGQDALRLTVCDTDPATITIVLPIPPRRRLPHTGFQILLWIGFGMTLLAAGLAMLKTRREWVRS